MADALFSITCTTCQARLKVRDPAIVGQITTCPRCESMVEIVAPPGWVPPAVTASPVAAPSSDPTPSGETSAAAPSAEAASPGTVATATAASAAPAVEPPPIPAPVAGAVVWRPWVVWGAGAMAAAVVAVAIWSSWTKRAPAPPATPTAAQPVPEKSTAGSTPAAADAPAVPDDLRWLPASARLMVEVNLAGLQGEADSTDVLTVAEPIWQWAVEPVLETLGIKRGGVVRVRWSASDLARCAESSVVLLRLADNQDATALEGMGQAVDLELAGHRCHELADGAWPHPFAVLDKQTVVTGRRELLAELARGAARPTGDVLARLLEHSPAQADVRVLVDLRAAREAGWPLPARQFDVWSKGRAAWHLVCDTPQGVGLALLHSGKPQTICALACETSSTAEKVLSAVEELLPAGRAALAARRATAGELATEGAPPDSIAQYTALLDSADAALEASHARQADTVVLVETAWPGTSSRVAVAARDSIPALRADWLHEALVLGRQRQEQMGAGLAEFQKTERKLPAGGLGGGLLAPETRLSWLAAMLPYLGHRDWHDRLQFAYNWNGNENRPVTSQPLEEVINPALGLSRTDAGFPVTHYVGLAGVGSDAASLPVTHPRAGVFGAGRTTRLEDIRDGASNTIAVLGVTERLGPWAAGGGATIRPLTKPPYVNGPDGFGSGDPRGMLAGMADGSVRFISKDVDPHVLEQLATINGGEGTTVAALEVKLPGGDLASPPDRVDPPMALAEGDRPGAAADPAQADQPQAVDRAGEATETGDGQPSDRPALEPVDVAGRLAVVIPSLSEPAITLRDLARFVDDFSGVPVTFDPAALELRGASLADRVEVRLKDASLGHILETGVSRRGLVVLPGEHSALVTCPTSARADLTTVRYDVSDLVGLEPDGLAQFGRMVQTLVAPDAWESTGGMGSLSADGTAMVIRQTELIHYQVLAFCERLRVARGLPLRSRFPADLFRTTTRAQRAGPLLERPVTVNFQPETPLEKALRYVEDQAGLALAIDWETLAAAGIGPGTDAAVAADKLPLSNALADLLRPLGLVAIPVNERCLAITTRQAAGAELDLEIYPIGPLLANGATEGQIVERIQGELAAGTWNDAGGKGVIVYDEPSDALFVLQSPLVQQAIGNWLRTAGKP